MSSLIQRSDQSHWYTRDGQPAYTTGNHHTTLRDARKLGLYPSVTTVMKLLAKPAVEDWRVEQAILKTLELERRGNAGGGLPGDTCEAIEEVGQVLDVELEKARTFGTRVHAGVEHVSLYHQMPKGLTGIAADLAPVLPWVEAYKAWKEANLTKVHAAELTVTSRLGYAGRVDLYACHSTYGDILVDFKTQNVKKRPVFYPEWSYQLAAYRMALLDAGSEAHAVLSLVIDSNTGATVYEKVWTGPETQHGWEVFTALLSLWKKVKKYDPVASPDLPMPAQQVTTGSLQEAKV